MGTNPILPGFHPDPSICRNGSDFYLATSSFEYFPGVPIFQSRDLVHWKQIGHALPAKENLDLTGVRCSGGIFAPTLRFHDGLFYMVTTLVDSPLQKGDFIVTATDPRGPWSAPHWIENAPGIDPSLFFDDDGTAYMCGNGKPEHSVHEKHRIIWVQKINLKTFQLEGPRGILDSADYFFNGKIGPANNFEGPHLYKKDGFYYLLVSHGGTSMNHAVSVWRSSSPLGPWEENPANPILTHRADRTPGLTCTGHADLIRGEDGRWWMVLLGVRGEDKWSVMGRETFLAPVDWSGIWPVVNPSHPGRVDFQVELPHSGPPSGMREKQGFRDDFHSGKLSPEWTTIRTPLESWWSFPKKPPSLRILLRPDQLWQDLQPSFLGIRITGPNCSASVRMEFDPKESGECSGLAILRSSSACWMLVIEQGDPGMQKLRASVYEGEKFLGSLPVDSPSVELRISLDFPRLSFDVRERSSAPWQTVATCDATALAKDPGGRFTGSFLGLYASSRGKPSSNRADFRLFDYTCIP